MDKNKTIVICPENDLESKTIIEISKSLGLDVRVSKQGWGAKLGKEEPTFFSKLKENLVVIEMPDIKKEQELKNAGHTLKIIDHHIYKTEGKHLDRSNELSSIEQFANLFNYQLTAHERLVALNDTGYIWSLLYVENISYSKIREIRESEFQAQGYTHEEREQSKEDYNNGKQFIFFKLVFTNLEKTAYLADLHQLPSEKRFKNFQRDPEKCPIKMHNLLVVTMNEDRPIEINFYGECKYIREFSELTKQSNAIYESWESSPRESGGFWGAKNRIEGKVVEGLLNSVLSSLLGPDRPYLKFSTVFLYPFTLEKIQEKSDFWQPRQWCRKDFEKNYQEYVYFHIYARNILFSAPEKNRKPTPVAYYEPKESIEESKSRLQIKFGSHVEKKSDDPCGDDSPEYENETVLTYTLTHLAIHSFYNDVAILAIQVMDEIFPKDRASKNDEPATSEDWNLWRILWQGTIETEENAVQDAKPEISGQSENKPDVGLEVRHKCRFVEDTMKFNQLARIIYWSYPEQQTEGSYGRIPDSVSLTINGKECFHHEFEGENILSCKNKDYQPIPSKLIEHLLQSFAVKGKYESLLDDRMYVYSFMALAGDAPKTRMQRDDYEALFSRILYVDDFGGGYYYERKFIRDLMRRITYRRWDEMGTRYGFTRYSSITTGFGSDFSDHIFDHFNTMYYQMALVALYYRSSLIDFSKRLNSITRKLVGEKVETKKRESFGKLRKDFVRFSNIYWFDELTNQDQGIDIFDLYKKAFQYEKMYNQVKEEIERADEIEHLHFKNIITSGGLTVAFLALLVGYFGMNFRQINDKLEWLFWPVTILCIALIISLPFIIRWRNKKILPRESK